MSILGNGIDPSYIVWDNTRRGGGYILEVGVWEWVPIKIRCDTASEADSLGRAFVLDHTDRPDLYEDDHYYKEETA